MIITKPLTPGSTGSSSKEGDEEEVLYRGRKVPRSVRLQQMRESQKMLREQRKHKVQILEKENYFLRQELEMLRKGIRYLKPRNVSAESFYPPSELDKLYTFERVTTDGLQKFAQHNIPYEIYSRFFIDGVCIVAKVLEAITLCIATEPAPECSERLQEMLFKYTPTEDLRKLFIEQLNHYVMYKTIPDYWKNADPHLPQGVMSSLSVVEFIVKHCEYEAISMDALKGFLARCTFATYWGPAIYVNDVIISVAAASDPDYDGDLIEGKLDDKLCNTSSLTVDSNLSI
ncbi:uncharacterized protein RJT21DRAFT_119415 [Scheffersomyces amazonensis]|uniref:uncharacterized protein n=1 Tax=Scheffersomyces amazonensis TaxID=1078765 RepID=UPI00315D2249